MAKRSRRGVVFKRRSAAATKGWETRRANEERARRSAAAIKGHETRRANERLRAAERERHSAARVKGWETRRRGALARTFAETKGTGRGDTPRNLAHRGLYDALERQHGTGKVTREVWAQEMMRWSEEYDLGYDWESASDSFDYYHGE